MTRRLVKITLCAAAAALAMSATLPVQAACTSDRTFGTYPSAGACGSFCYINSNGNLNNSASVKGFYWVLGQGPTRNSGGYEFNGVGGSQPWFIRARRSPTAGK